MGAGVVVTPEQIKEGVQKFLNENQEEIMQKRYSFNFSELMRRSRKHNRFAEGAALTKELKAQWEALLGPKTEEDTVKKPVVQK